MAPMPMPIQRGSLSKKPIREFYTFPCSTNSAASLEVILVHGCWHVNQKFAKSLYKSAKNISKGPVPCRVHIFSYNAAKLLLKGKTRFRDLFRLLLGHMTTLSAGSKHKRLALVAHSTAAWLVQEAIVQWQYVPCPGSVPTGIAIIGLLHASEKVYWPKEIWEKFRDDLLVHLKAANTKKSYPKLDYTTVESTMSQFEHFLANLRNGPGLYDHHLMTWGVAYTKERNIPTITRSATVRSNDSISTSGSGLEDLKTMFVKISDKEEGDLLLFLKAASKATPLMFPLGSPPGTPVPVQTPIRRQSVASMRSPSWERRSTQRTPSVTATLERRVPRNSLDTKPDSRPASANDSVMMSSLQDFTLPHRHRQEFRRATSPSKTDAVQPKISSHEGSVPDLKDGNDVFTVQKPNSDSLLHGPSAYDSELIYKTDLAFWYYDRGDLVEADRIYTDLRELYESKKKVDPNYLRICLNQAQIICITGHYQKSETRLQQLFTTLDQPKPKEPKLLRDTGKWLAISQLRQGKYKAAQCTIETCRGMLPLKEKNATSLLSTLALVLASAGHFRLAWKYSQRVIYPDATLNISNVLKEDGTRANDFNRRLYYQDHIKKREDYRTCLFNHACILSELGRFHDAAIANDVALEDMQKHLGPQHFVTLDAASVRAWLLVFNDSSRQTVQEVQRTLRETRERQGKDHPSTLQNMQTLVLMYKGQGRYSDAEETASYLVSRSIQNQSLGASHPQTLKSKSIQADVLLALGKWKDAEAVQRAIIEVEPANYFFQTSLAITLRTRGKWDQARELGVRVLIEQLHKFSNEDDGGIEDETDEFEDEEIHSYELKKMLYASKYVRKRLQNLPQGLLDPVASHSPVRVYPSLIQSLYCVALCEQVREDASLMFVHGILEKLHDIFCRRLGEKHRMTVNVEYDLAVNHRLRGNFKNSLSLIDEVLSERRRLLETDHPDYLLARHQRAVTLLRLGKWKEALAEQTSTLKAQEALLGADHADAIISRYTLAGIYQSLNRASDADDLIDQVIKEQIYKYNLTEYDGEDHPIVLRSRARHALILVDLQKYAKAEDEQNRVYQWRRKHLKDHHNMTRGAYNDLAQIKQAAKQFNAAYNIYDELLQSFAEDRRRKQLEIEVKENPLEFQVRSNLASCCFEMGDYSKAESIQSTLRAELCDSRNKRRNDQREIAATFNLAFTRRMLGRWDSAEEPLGAKQLLQIAIKRAEEILTADHPRTQELKATMQLWKREQKQNLAKNEDSMMLNSNVDFSRVVSSVL